MIIGVDPHKGSHTATALDPATNQKESSLRIDATLAGYRQLTALGPRIPRAVLGYRERTRPRPPPGAVARRSRRVSGGCPRDRDRAGA